MMADLSLPSVFQCYIYFVLFSVFVRLWLFEPLCATSLAGRIFESFSMCYNISALDWREGRGASLATGLGWYGGLSNSGAHH